MINKPKLVILGSGGHAKVLIDTLFEMQLHEQWDFVMLTPDIHLHGTSILNVPIVGDDSTISQQINMGATHFSVGVGGIGSNILKSRLYTFGCQHRLTPLNVIHPRAICSRFAKFGNGIQIFAGAIVNVHATLGNNTIINSGAIIEHDCTIGSHVHIAPGARLSGNVVVGDGAHIGTGASIRQGINIGENAIVGVGAVVVKDVLPDTTVMGVPAKLKYYK